MIYIYILHLYYYLYITFTLKKVYDRNVVNKYKICLLLGVIIFNIIDYIPFIYILHSIYIMYIY